MQTKVKCPKCGASFEIPEHESVQTGTVIAKDSGLGTVYLKVEDGGEGLPKRDKSGKFVSGKSGKSGDAACGGGSLSSRIRKGGHVRNYRPYRRWIMAQVFHMLDDMDKPRSYRSSDFTGLVRQRGMKYMWKVIRNEFHDITAICRHGDIAEYCRRRRWFNEKLVVDVAFSFLSQLRKQIDALDTHTCRGRPYKAITGFGNVFSDELEAKVFSPICGMISGIQRIVVANCSDMSSVNNIVRRLCDFCEQFHESTKVTLSMPESFINAYKGNGGYFTVRNMIMFHGCHLPGEKFFDESRDLAKLDAIAEKNKDEGWQMIGLVKDVIAANGIDIRRKMDSWKKRK